MLEFLLGIPVGALIACLALVLVAAADEPGEDKRR